MSEKLEWRRRNRIIACDDEKGGLTDERAIVSAQGHKDPAEKELVERARQGDRAAFEALVRSHESISFSFALNITGGHYQTAEDILQEALIHAYCGIASFRGDSSFSTWLWRILKNDFLRYRKRNAQFREEAQEQARTLIEGHGSAVEERVIHEERLAHLRRFIARLDIDDQEVLTLIEFQELSIDAAAVVTGLSIEAFKSRLHRARKRLAEMVKKNKNLFL